MAFHKNDNSDNIPLLRIISGAKYSGVPHIVKVLFSTFLAKPKSVSFKNPFVLINMFSGFKSLYIIFKLCR